MAATAVVAAVVAALVRATAAVALRAAELIVSIPVVPDKWYT
jgi:hypothetical protein